MTRLTEPTSIPQERIIGATVASRALAACGFASQCASLPLRSRKRPSAKVASLLLAMTCALSGCGKDTDPEMRNQPKISKVYLHSDFFADHRSARPLPTGVVARGQAKPGDPLYTGVVDGKIVETFPFPITEARLQRGQERFNIYCSACHGQTGYGNGMIVQRGFIPPPSYHTDRLRNIGVGHFFDVMTNGYGAMYDVSDRVSVEDRWCIAAYIRALQISQNVPKSALQASDLEALKNANAPSTQPAETNRAPGGGIQ